MPPDRPPRASHWVHVLAIGVVCAALYLPVLDAPFVFDDLPNITHNPFVRVDEPTLAALGSAAFESRSPRPFANLTFALNHAACGYRVSCYRAVNIAVHYGCGVLVYGLALLLLGRLGRDGGRSANAALVAALVFVAHPIQTQSVTYVVQRMTCMATLFYLGALLLAFHGRGRTRRWTWWTGAAVLAALSFATKQIAASLPLALLLIEWQFFQDASRDWLRRRRALLLGVALAIALLGVAYLALLGFPGYENRDFTAGERVLTQLRVVVFYLGLLLWPLPSRLSLIHDFPVSTSLFEPLSTLFCGLALLLLAAVGLASARRARLASFAILWFFLQLALESSVLPLEIVYEHRLYLPLFGLALLVGDGVFRLGAEWRGWLLGGAIVVALSVATVQRNAVWSDAVRLWSDVVSKSRFDARAQLNLAHAYRAAGRLDEAQEHFEALVRDAPGWAQSHEVLGQVLAWRSEPERALEHYTRAAALAPGEPSHGVNRGLLLAQLGRTSEAVAVLEGVVAGAPDHPRAHFALGRVVEAGDRPGEAVAHYRRAVGLDPDFNAAHLRLARLLFLEGALDEAAAHAREALRIDPDQLAARTLIERASATHPSGPGTATSR